MTRIPVKTQRWLWWGNVFIQPPLAAMFAWLLVDAESGIGMKLFAAVFGLFAVILFGFALLMISRTVGRTYEILIDETSVTIPNIVRGTSTQVLFAAIERATIHETPTATTTFFMLHLTVRNAKPVVVASQMIGPDAFHQLCDLLRARGVTIG